MTPWRTKQENVTCLKRLLDMGITQVRWKT